MSPVPTWTADFKSRAADLAGSHVPWLAAMRQRAMQRFGDEGWPTAKQDNWRHTTLAVLAQQSFATAAGPCTLSKAYIDSVRQGEPGHWLVFVDGHFAPQLSEIGSLPQGAQISPLSQALAQQPEQVEPYFGQDQDGASTAALNLALASDGAFIQLAPGVDLALPVHLVFVAAAGQGASFVRNLIVAQAGSRATVVEHYLGQGDSATFTNAVTRTVAAADAHVTHLKLQQESEQAFHLGAIDAQQAQGSVFNSHSMSFGARLARSDIVTRFDGQRCETLLNGLYYVDGRRHVDHHTRIEHAQPNGISREYYRGILADTGRGVFSGRIRVAPGADGTDAVQRSDSLLLSRMARADARPELEIYADDVKCAHGATVGQIDENSLFYLQSRGLDPEHARNLVTYAFAAETLARIEHQLLRQRVEKVVRALLPGGDALGELS
jgi:Fe-S cluster assembly protein SufD